jgi:MFS family permease
VLAILAVVVETRAAEPLVPMRVVRERTTALAIVASVAVGMGMFGSAVFLGQYFQVARGYSATEAGLLTIPMMFGSFLGSVGSGQLITRFGKWKRYLVVGALFLTAGLGLLGTIDHTSPYWYVGLGMLAMGIGMGMTMQNLVLAVQNTVAASDLGAASSAVAFFRSLGGTIGVSVLGAVLSSHVGDLIRQGLSAIPGAAQATSTGSVGLADFSQAPPAIRTLIRVSYGDATGRVFLISAIMGAVALVAIVFIREVALRTQSGEQRLRTEAVPDELEPAAV